MRFYLDGEMDLDHMTLKTAISAGAFCLLSAAATSGAQAQTIPGTTGAVTLPSGPITLNNGSVANITQTVVGLGNTVTQTPSGTGGSVPPVTPILPGAGATAVVNGTLTQGGTSSAFSCTYGVVSGQIGGGAACNQILGGAATGGVSISLLDREVVSARVDVALANQASANARLLDDLATRRIGIDVAVAAQAELQAAGAVDTSSIFGDPQYGGWASAGGNFFNDERFGFEREGDNKVVTAGIDHRVDNWMVGLYGGYLDTNIDLISLDGDLESDGWLLGAYATRILDDVFSVTGAASYADTQSHLARNSGGARITSAFEHTEWSAALNGNAFWLVAPNFGFTGTAGVSYDTWRDGAYTDSAGTAFAEASGKNVWGKLAGTVTFFAGAVRPYANVTYGRLFTDPDFYMEKNRTTAGIGIGLGQGRLNGVIEVNTLLFNEDQRDTTIGLHLRLTV